MRPVTSIRGLLVLVAAIGTCLPPPLLAAPSAPQEAAISDVALWDGGLLVGQVVDPQGTAKVNVPVAISSGNRRLAVSRTDQNGYFAFGGLRGGAYQLATEEGSGLYRLWAPGTAPPSAQPGALVVAGGNTIRGQAACPQYAHNGLLPGCPWGGRVRFWLSHPWVLTGLAATAVTVPVVIVATHDHEPFSPD